MKEQEPQNARAFRDPDSTRHVIRNDWFEATFQPLAGGRMLELQHVEHGDILVPLQDAAFDPANWPKAGAYPLFPFHNRLNDAKFWHDGELIRLRPNSASGSDVMHGPAHRRPWDMTDTGPHHVEMALTYEADEDWPFDFTATQRFALDGDALTVDLTLTNSGAVTMPGGVGWHPYFKAQDGNVLTDAASHWTPLGPKGLPERRVHPNGSGIISIQYGTTEHFADWTYATCLTPDGARITLCADAPLPHLVLHAQPGYQCIEPASHVAGAFVGLPGSSAETGLRLLEPGESLAGQVTLRVDRP